jgi:phage/plasmid-like protein (TIGR03299 family)
MAHEITIRANNTAEMAYTGEKPWHNLGQQLDAGSSIETWQAAAGMDWRIQRSKVRYFADRDGATQLEMPDQHVLFRSDTKEALGLVSAKYKTVQPAQVLEFFRELTEGAGFELSTAGTLFGGKKFWALAKLPEAMAEIGKGDMLRGYLLLATSCDGSSATTGKFVCEKVVCNNTLTMAMGEAGKAVKVSHRNVFNAEKLKQQLGAAQHQFASVVDAARALSRVRISRIDAEAFVRGLLRPSETPSLVSATGTPFDSFLNKLTAPADDQRAPRGEADILRLFNGAQKGDNLPGMHGTAWGLLNAVTEYVDHHATAKSDSHRMNSAWFNGGDDLKTEAFEKLLALV